MPSNQYMVVWCIVFLCILIRFAKWVEGESHLSEDELDAYDFGPMPDVSRDSRDEDEIDFRLTSP